MPDLLLELPVPESGFDFDNAFFTHEACLVAIIKARWPEGFACPECGRRHALETQAALCDGRTRQEAALRHGRD
jgi:hypothetical protein